MKSKLSHAVGSFLTSAWARAGLGLLVLLAGMLEPATGHAQRRRTIPINLVSVPAGAEVFFEGKSVGRTPLRSVRLPRKRIELLFRLPNHEDVKLQINNRRRRKTYRVTLQSLGVLVISPGNDAARGASLRVDGRALGILPFRTNVKPGRHHIEVVRQGFVPHSSWHDVRGGQMLTLPISLAASTGSIWVVGDIQGTPVFLDGEAKGATPLAIDQVPEGKHTLELRPPNLPVYTEEVTVKAGQRTTVNPGLRATGKGSLKILSNVPGAIVFLDGEELGPAPLTKDGISSGEHVVEAVAEGFQRLHQRVKVTAGATEVLQLDLQGLASAQRIVVSSTVAQAQVRVDGKDQGAPPVVIENAPPGEHSIVITAPGYKDYITTCTVGKGRSCVIDAVLEPTGTPVRFTANVNGAQLFVDGKPLGPVPFEGTIPVGHHRVEIRAPGYQPYVEQVQLAASAKARVFKVRLLREGLTAEQMQELARQKLGAVSHAAGPLPIDLAVLDLSVGYPYLFEVRMSTGILDFLEGGFAARSFWRLSEFELRLEVGKRPLPQVGGAIQLRVGGGIGPRSVNTFYTSLEALGSMYFTQRGAFTLVGAADLFSDHYPYTAADSDVVVGTAAAQLAGLPTPRPEDVPRQTETRLRLGGVLEFVLGRRTNVWAELQGVLVGKLRRAYGDVFGLIREDTKFYFRLGMTHKF